jgi:3-methyladenine DNA glycosylase AlkC
LTTPRRPQDVPKTIRDALSRGDRESRTLAEGLAVDFRRLLRAVDPTLTADDLQRLDPKAGVTRRMAMAATILLERHGPGVYDELAGHPSDTVRGWAAYVLGMTPKLTLAGRLKRIRPLADDTHFGVREWAWIGIRQHIVDDPTGAIARFEPWTRARSANVRRFAVEATRPRGVWCAHIEALKEEPAPGLVLLEPLRAAPEKYVQDSVANWLNDAAKTTPDWVRSVCARWSSASDNTATARICRRAMRSL